MTEATWADPYAGGLSYQQVKEGWQANFDGFGNLTGYWRPVAVDDSRGARQQGVVGGTDQAFEFVSADKWNGGAPKSTDVEYRTSGTDVNQNDPSKLVTLGIPLALAAIAGGAAGQAAGLWNLGGAAGEAAGGGLLGGAGGGLSQAELAALVESGTQGGAGLGLEAAAMNGMGLTPAQYAALQGGGSLVAQGGIDSVVNAALTGAQTPVGIDPTGSNVLRYDTPPTGTTPDPTKTTTPPGKTTPDPKTTGFTLPTDLPGWLKLLAPLAASGLLYKDAADANGQVNGYQPAIDIMMANAKKQFAPPAFTTNLSHRPQFSTQFYQPEFKTGLLG